MLTIKDLKRRFEVEVERLAIGYPSPSFSFKIATINGIFINLVHVLRIIRFLDSVN